MGVWGSGPFDNDDAADWVSDLEDADDLTIALDALERVRGSDYVDAYDASVAIAAAEVVAAAAGAPRADLPAGVAAWLTDTDPDVAADHGEAATAAIARVRGDDSELAELWAEDDPVAWHDHLDDLVERLGR